MHRKNRVHHLLEALSFGSQLVRSGRHGQEAELARLIRRRLVSQIALGVTERDGDSWHHRPGGVRNCAKHGPGIGDLCPGRV